MKKLFIILTLLFVVFSSVAQDFKVLLVDDDNYTVERDPIITALTNGGYSYSVLNAYDAVPTYSQMEQYDIVLWYTGNDGTTNLWQAENGVGSRYQNDLIEFAKNGGIVWVDGIDFLYDIVGGAPDDFSAGSFIYDTLGIAKYLDQSYADDGNTGVSQYDISAGNTITNIDPVYWTYSTLHYADGLELTSSAHPLYQMTGGTYPLAGEITALYNEFGTSAFITSGFRLSRLKTQDMIDNLVDQILTYSKNNWDTEANSISPATDQTISLNTDGTTLTVDETVGWDSREWKYSTTQGGPYQSFASPETGKSYTPNFSTAGTYYVVCETTYGSTTKTSNEVKITVLGNSVVVTPADNQYNFTGIDGTILTEFESPASADSREWKYSIAQGGPYQSFSTPETGTTYTPNFAEKGIYYVVCEANFGGNIVTSNEVKIIVDTAASDYYLAFDGDDSFYIQDDNQDYINVSDNWTFETWVRVDDYQSGTYPVIMDRDKCFSMYVQADNDDDFSIAFVKRDASDNIVASLSSANVSSVQFNFGQWYHIAADYDGTTARLFVNGTEVDNSTDDFTLLAASTDYINVGARYRSGYERFLTGALENIQISKKARYTSDFTPNFYAPMQADTNSVVCLNLEDNPNSELFDFSGHFTNISLRNSPNNPDWELKAENSVTPADVQNLVQNQDGNVLTVNENGLANSREWKYATVSGGPYQSFSPAQTDKTYTPNFSNTGTYYIVCISNFNGADVTSNEVQINVSEAASITTGAISGSPFYVSEQDGHSVDVPFTITGTFNSDNVFSAYLSDENGDFTNEVLIGFMPGNTDGTINAEIPAGTTSGTGYRIRVEASSPIVVGTDNGSDIEIIKVSNAVTPTDDQFIEVSQDGNTLTVTENPTADSREWMFATTQGGPYQSFASPETGTTYTPNFDTPGTYYIVCKSVFDGGNVSTFSNEVVVNVETSYKILFVNDDNNGDESEPIDTALTHSGFTYYKVNTTDSVPTYDFMNKFNLVLWYTGNDATTNIWDNDTTFIDAVEQYVANGGTFWLDGLDWIYDIYEGAPDTFPQNSFMYEKLGISEYISQSYADDGHSGAPQMDITAENKVTSENPITWQYSSLWYGDGLAVTDEAIPLYVFGGDGYTLAGQVTSLYRQENTGTYLTTGLRLARLGDGSTFVQDSVDKIINEVIAYDQESPAVYCGDIQPTLYYVTATNGAEIKIPFTIDGGFDFGSDNVFTAYLSDASGDFANEVAIGTLAYTAGDTITAIIPAGTPNGNAYRIRIKASDPDILSGDNGVDITVVNVEVNVTPTDEQTIYVGEDGNTLTVSETPEADSREWKYSTTQGGSYQSFDTPETATTYTPNFANPGTYYVVCEAHYGSNVVLSNEVIINVLEQNSITTGSIAGSPFTVTETEGTSVDVPFTITGSFESDNVFTAYLSDASGDFTNEVAIGSLASNEAGTITAEIPAGTPSGTGYRIRVKSSNPEITGSDNGEDLEIVLSQGSMLENVNGGIAVYPNPVGTVLYISTSDNAVYNVEFVDNLGRIVKVVKTNGQGVDVSDLKPGTYTVRIYNSNGFKVVNLLKM